MRHVTLVDDSGRLLPVVRERADPRPPTGAEVHVRVAASSINGSDLGLRRSQGLMRIVTARSSPGFDMAGIVVRCGPRVSSVDVGDRVMALLDHRGGGLAETILVNQDRLAIIPDEVTDVDAAAMPLAGLTALQALRRQGRLQRNGRAEVLVNGAAGGIGSYAVQLARIFGARVTAVTSSDRAAYVRQLGADDVIDRQSVDASLGRRTFDLILDVPGAWRYRTIRHALSPGGVVVSTRPITADRLRVALPGSSGRRSTAVATSASPPDLAYLARLVLSGDLVSPVDRVFELDQVEHAFAHAESGRLRGKVVITV